MRDNSRVRTQRFALSLDARQVTAVVLGALILLGGAFLLGMSAGRQATVERSTAVATGAVLERLDEPLTARAEPPPVLAATQALTDTRAIEKAAPTVAVTDTRAIEKAAPVATRTAIAKSAPLPSPLPASRGEGASHPTSTSTGTAKSPHPRGYTIQVASASTRGDAERIVRKLSERNPRIVAVDVPGKGKRYRVQVGTYPSQEAAKRQLPLLARAGIHGIVTSTR